MTLVGSSRNEHRFPFFVLLLLLRHSFLLPILLLFATSQRKDVVPHAQLQSVHHRLTEAPPTAKQDKNGLVIVLVSLFPSIVMAVIAGAMTYWLDVHMILLPHCLPLPSSFLACPRLLYDKLLGRVDTFGALVKCVEE
jgi:Na+/melibiose symporter-like transporter